MKPQHIIALIALISISIFISIAVVGVGAGCCSSQVRSIRQERERVNSFISIGQDITQAQTILKANGYKLLYDKPTDPTNEGKYLQQLVVIGNTNPTASDTFFYVVTGGRNPLSKESPYVEIKADIKGKITRIE